MKKATAYIDGSGNSERIQACATVLYLDGESHKRSRLLPPNTTNNVGEYGGLLLALELAAELGIDELKILSDSKLIVQQVCGYWKCKQPHLIPLRDKAREDARVFKKVSIHWIPREGNTEADALCREAVEAHEKHEELIKAIKDNPFIKT